MKNTDNTSLTSVSKKVRPNPSTSSETLGRSMVEMLGVLAIIGVLSAGALAGYSKAMFRHKMNQTIDEANKIFQRFEEIVEKDWGTLGTGSTNYIDTPEMAIQFKLIDDCKNKSNILDYYQGCQLPVGFVGFDLLQQKGEIIPVGGYFMFYFTDSKSCSAFLSAQWQDKLSNDWWYPKGRIFIQTDKSYQDLFNPSESISQLTMNNIISACSGCNNGSCQIYIKYKTYY